jgi:long-chain fatty acid transport protein
MEHKTTNKLLKSLFVISLSGLLFGISQSANASGFALAEQSASGLGNAFAGAAAANDASTVWYNPAGMTRLKKSDAVAAFHSITPSIEFTDNGSTGSFLVGSPASTGGDGGDAGHAAIVPNIYYTMPLDDGITFGLGINGPFGLSTEYDKDWKGRYFGVESAVKVVNINPSLAFKVDDSLSLGIGLNLQQMDVVLSKAIDQEALCNAIGLAASCGSGVVPALRATDAFAEIDGTSTSWGANLGLMYEFSETTRLGFAYRSVVRHSIHGDGDFTDADSRLNATPLGDFFVDTDAKSDITLPASASLNFYHDLMSNLALMADLTWTEWSKLDEVRIEYDAGAQGATVEEFGWSNTLRYSVGATYSPMAALVLRAGVALDEAPVDDKSKRGVRLPDNDRLWVSIGAGYEVMKGLAIDLSYASLTIDDAEIDRSEALAGNIKGEYSASTNILSAQANWKF